jgi:hypothetical protein
VNLSKGRLGEDVAALLGSLLRNQVEVVALSRAESPESRRHDYFLYVDEAHLVATTTMIDLFPEARKYHLGVILAHQYLEQLPEDLRCALLGNVGTLAVFRVGGRDAEILGTELAPECRAGDLVHLSAHQMCLKLQVNGTTSPPFTVSTFPAPQSLVSHRDQIIAATRAQYCHPVAEVERDILHAWRTTPPATQPQQQLRFSP